MKKNRNYWSDYQTGKILQKDIKISRELPQFEDKKVLFAVVGKQTGRLLLVNKGTIKELEFFHFSKPKYSDKEGFFMTRGQAGVYKTGAVYEPKKEKITIEQKKVLGKEIKRIFEQQKPDEIYIFVPKYIKNKINEGFPSFIEERISRCMYGEYVIFHPFDLIKRAQKEVNVPATPLKEDAEKIFKKPNQRSP